MRWYQHAVGAIMLAVLPILVSLCAAQAQSASPGSVGSGPGASVFFPQKVFEFQPVIDGVKVIHDFVVMNTGSVPLLISDVRTG
jgi:hypothetical protein